MTNSGRFILIALVFILAISLPIRSGQDNDLSDRMAIYNAYLEFPSLVKGGIIEVHWMADGHSFWFAEGMPESITFYKVDPVKGSKERLFDTERLRHALLPLLEHELPYKGLPFTEFSFRRGEKAVEFTVEGKNFLCDLETYTVTPLPQSSPEEKARWQPRIVRQGFPTGVPGVREKLSPDRRWFLGEKDYNLYLRSTYDGRFEALTKDGVKDYEWFIEFPEGRYGEGAKWSPDSTKVAAAKVDTRKVDRLPVVHWLKQTEEVEFIPYPKAGRAMPQTELFIIDILSKKKIRIETGDQSDLYLSILGWLPDGSELLIGRMNREKKRLDLMTVDPADGTSRIILTETQKTFVAGQRPPYSSFTLLKDGKRFIWKSERSGWAHLYLYDLSGSLIRQLTRGSFPVLQVVAVDEKDGWVYFTAHAEERLYDTHLYRVSLGGDGFGRLTEAVGQHAALFSPSRDYFVDVHSSHERPPSSELRRADGTRVLTLSEANIDALEELRWSPPEEFVVKAADGETDLYGIMYKPYDFDQGKKYPVIDNIYGGPQMTWVTRTFSTRAYGGIIKGTMAQALAQLGFVVITLDGRGTPERGKAFQDIVYGNIGRNEIPDHVAALKQLAAERSYMDLSRVGIFGISWGGYMTIRAALLAPDVYHVGVATHPVTDLYQRMYPIEPYMGLPQNNTGGYEHGSNLRLADKLKGKLLIIHGSSDVNASFDATMKMAEAFIRAGKPFDLLVMPGQDHLFNGVSGKAFRYWLDAVPRYFLDHFSPEN